MTTGITRHLLRFMVAFLFAIGILVGGLVTPTQNARAAAQAPHTASKTSRPMWGVLPNSRGSQYQCCYSGKGEDVLFIHGVDGSYNGADGNDPNGNCQVNFGNAINLAGNSYQWVGNLVVLQYYTYDHCTISGSNPQNMTYASMRNSAHSYYCNGYFDGNDGTNNEDDKHLACLLAWYIWDNYTVNTWTVNVVAHSLGGVLLKEALYQINVNHDSHFPAYLFLDHVVTLSSPLGGIPEFGDESCGECWELTQLEWGVSGGIWGDLTSSAGQGVQGLGGTTWLMEGEAGAQCDPVGNSAFEMSYGIKVDYSYQLSGISGMPDACNTNGGYYYGHGTYLADNQTIYNATVNYCNGCSGNPSSVYYNFPRSLVEMFWGLAGNCANSPNTNNCDGDDPNVTGCSSTGHLQSGDVSYLKIYWSTGCSTNWAIVNAPSGYLVKVTLARSPTRSWSNVDRHLIYCAPSRTSCPSDTWWTFGQYTTSWITDMLYAPNESVAVQIVTSTGATYTSIWH